MAHLEIKTKNGVRKLRLDGRVTTIGRSPDCHLTVKDKESSREHCAIEPVDEGYRLRDLGSRNGTRLNNEKVAIELLDHNDVIRIGKTVMRFIDEEQTRPPRPKRRKPAGDNGAANLEEPATAQALAFDLKEAVEEEKKPYDESLRDIINNAQQKPFELNQVSLIDTRGQTVHQASGEDDEEDLGEGIRAFRLMLLACFCARATDLHLEPRQDGAAARIRVDGFMVSACDMNRSVFQRVFGLVKILCQIDTSRKNVVQEGHFSVAVPGRRVDYRVSFTPSMHGQKLVIRVLDTANVPTRLHELGMVGWMHDKVQTITTRDAGMIVACGPTGSGKTTTLYSCLREIDTDLRNVITIEDPVEYSLEGCTQIPIDAKQGNTFGEMLRSVLRQDPDVIYVGEIRDPETAKTAMQAAMTGHLVFTTVHAKDSIGSIFRMLDLGVEPYLVANSVNLIIAQRLVRILCDSCKKPTRPTPEAQRRMGRQVDGMSTVYVPVGCRQCLRTGFLGRRAIFELLEMTDELRDIVLNRPAIQDIRRVVNQGLFHTLRESGYQLVARGDTSVDEIERVAGNE